MAWAFGLYRRGLLGKFEHNHAESFLVGGIDVLEQTEQFHLRRDVRSNVPEGFLREHDLEVVVTANGTDPHVLAGCVGDQVQTFASLDTVYGIVADPYLKRLFSRLD